MDAIIVRQAEPNTLNFFKGYEDRFKKLMDIANDVQEAVDELNS
jgi:predicted RecB family nuclease